MGINKFYKGKNAVITGASSGIGKSFAIELAKLGTNLVICARNLDKLEEVRNEIVKYGVKAIAIKCDVTDENQVHNLAERSISEMKDIHFLFSNAGIATGGPFEYLTTKEWKNIMDVNIWGTIFTIKAFIKKMLIQKYGHIVVTSSISGSFGIGGLTPYNTTKFAVSGFCEALYGEYINKGINVSILCPFPLNTNLIDAVGMSFPPNLFDDLSPEDKVKALSEAKGYYWEKFTEKKAPVFGGFGCSHDLDDAIKKYLHKIQKKKLYIFENKYGRMGQFMRGASPNNYKRFLRFFGKKHLNLLNNTFQIISDYKK